MASCTLDGAGYTLSIHDNEPSGPEGKGGHNGIRRWQLDAHPDFRLVAHSWLNLEHVITEDTKFFGNKQDPGFFEPRQFPVQLESSEDRIRLSHDPLPRTGCACWIEYTPGDRPGSLDFQLGFTPTRRIGPGKAIGLFLPCYVYQPEHKSIHFIGRRNPGDEKRWVEYCSSCHRSVVNFASDRTEHPPGYETDTFATYMDIVRHSYPFIWGRTGPYAFTLMVDGGEDLDLRFWMSPTGGGRDPHTRLTNPAWDSVVLRFGYEIDREYTARGRLVVRPMQSRNEAIEEYEIWSGQTVAWESGSPQ